MIGTAAMPGSLAKTVRISRYDGKGKGYDALE